MDKRLVILEKRVNLDNENISDIHNKIQKLVIDTQTIGKDCENFAFEAFKKCENLMSSANMALSFITNEDYELVFTPDQKIEQFLSSLTLLGEFKTIPDNLDDILENSFGNQSFTSTDHVYTAVGNISYNIRSRNDKKLCHITSMCQLPTGQTVIVDCSNEAVKLLSDPNYSIIDELLLPSYPFQICHTTGEELAVTVNLKQGRNWVRKEIHFITAVESKLSHTRTFHLGHCCRSIAYHNGQLFVGSGEALYVYNLFGQLIRKLYEDIPLGLTVYNISLSHDGDRIYVINYGKNILVTLDSSGKRLYSLDDPKWKGSMNVCVAENDSVFVCDIESNTIVQIDKEGRKKMKTLATEDDGILKPRSLCYCKAQRLLIGQWDNDNILELQLK